jgi:hypothetical protein
VCGCDRVSPGIFVVTVTAFKRDSLKQWLRKQVVTGSRVP